MLNKLIKPEYFFQPQVATQRLLMFWSKTINFSNDEFIDKALPWGSKIRVRPQEEHGKILSTLGVIDLVVTETLWRLTQPGELVVDIGANIGYMTSVFAARLNSMSGGTVWSFEAHPDIFSELKFNANYWQEEFKTVKILAKNYAISEQKGKLQIQVPDTFVQNRGLSSVVSNSDFIEGSIVVDSYSLDDLFFNSQQIIGTMKIDVEGHELQVLNGAQKLLKEHKIRDCVFEEHQEYPTAVTNLFEDYQYKVFRLHRSFLKPLLLNADSTIPRTSWEPTSFIATCNPDRITKLFEKSGWQCLNGISK